MQLRARWVHGRPGDITLLVLEVDLPDLEFSPLQLSLNQALLGLDVLEKLCVLGELRADLDIHVLLNTCLWFHIIIVS